MALVTNIRYGLLLNENAPSLQSMYRWFWLWSRELWDCWLVGLWVPTWQSDLLLSKDIHLNAIISLPFDLWLWEQIVRAHYRFLPPTGQNQSPPKTRTQCPANLGGVTKISYFATLLVVCVVALKQNLSHNLEKPVHCIVFLEVATVKANQQVIRIPGEKIRLFKRWLQRHRAKPNKLWWPNVR